MLTWFKGAVYLAEQEVYALVSPVVYHVTQHKQLHFREVILEKVTCEQKVNM